MTEVDENLNFLLGRLSLVTQEFNQIKTGLGSALDNIRSSFQVVQNQIQGKSRSVWLYRPELIFFFGCVDVGPGPHKIEDDHNGSR